MDDLLQEFVAETRETLEALAGEIVAWEANPADRARLDAIFRFVHTVKGSCGFLDLPRLARLSHAAEDVLAAVRDGQRTPDAALVNAVLAIVDRIGELVEAIDAGVALDDWSEDLLIAALAEDAVAVAPAATAVMHRSVGRSIRLHVDLLDRMMSGMSDMVLARNELARRLREGDVDPRVEASLERLSATVADMRDTVTRTRMQKIEALFTALPRLVRDVAAELGKAVTLKIDGGDVEIDREMIEMLRDPLVHIVRNSIDHGIEAPAARRAAGKPETGRLTVGARQSGNQILVEIVDDGAGVDVARIVAKAVATGVCSEAEAAAMSEAHRTDLIFAPGLSSRDAVTTLSGRGVGMDVVRANIEQIGGRVALTNRPGKGLAIVIQVPLTLSILSTVVLRVGDHRFAMPRQAIEEIVSPRSGAVRISRVGDTAVAAIRGERLPLVSLGDLLALEVREPAMLAVIATRDGRFVLGFDAVLDTEELVVKPAAPAVMRCGLYAGQTLPDSGLPMLLLDGAGIASVAGLRFGQIARQDDEATADDAAPGLPVLLFDDLDGCRRAVALAAIDRVETVAPGALVQSAGRLRLDIDGRLTPVHHVGAVDTGREVVVLRLTDGEQAMCYAVAEPLGIVSLPRDLAAVDDAAIAGVALIDGRPVELIDVHRLFASSGMVGTGRGGSAAPLCLLHDDPVGWMVGFLKPVIEAAGYRCVDRLEGGQTAAVALTLDQPGPADLPTIRLSRTIDPTSDAIYRYDRSALLAALDERRAAGARA